MAVGLPLILWRGKRRLISSSFLSTSLVSLGTIVSISYSLPLALSVHRPIFYPDRYTIADLPALVVLLAAATYSAAARSLSVWLLSSLMLISVATHILTRENNPEPRFPQGPLSGDRVISSWLLKHLQPGDAVVFAGLSRASMDYYFLRSGASGRFFEVSYPQSIDDHLGWRPRDAAARRWDTLHSDAMALAGRLKRLQGPGRRIWLLSDGDAGSDVMKKELDRRFQQVSARATDSWAVTAIYSYCCISSIKRE